jgi:hypothetical protein
MLRLDLQDGSVLGFTDHDQVLAFDLGTVPGASITGPTSG